MNIIQIPANGNNYSKGRSGKKPNKIILHWIVGTLASADATFQNPNRKASAHYGIEDNIIHQYVNENDTAWHASNWDVNQESIGIEHSGGELLADGTRRKPSEQTHQTSANLVKDICNRYSIPIDSSHILPHKKYSNTECPGSLDINKIIDLAKNIDNNPIPPDNVELIPKPVAVGDILRASTTETSDNERDSYINRNINIHDICVDIYSGNDRFYKRWVEPRVVEGVNKAILENDAKWHSDIVSAKNEIERLNKELDECKNTKVEGLSALYLIKVALSKLISGGGE